MHRFKRAIPLRVPFTVYGTLKPLRFEKRPKQRRKGRFLRVPTLRVPNTDGTLKDGREGDEGAILCTRRDHTTASR